MEEAESSIGVFSINGYGVPTDILNDHAYDRYLSQCAEIIFGLSTTPTIILCGGATNPRLPEKTEAGEMCHWFRARFPEQIRKATVLPIKNTFDLRGNFAAMATILGWEGLDGPMTRFAAFVRYERQDFPTYLAGYMFPRATVIPIRVGGGSLELERIKQLLLMPLRIAATHSTWVCENIERPLRRLKIGLPLFSANSTTAASS